MSIINPSTYLDFVQRSAQECRMASVPSSVIGQAGQALDFCNWVAEAWREVQTRHENWGWMRLTMSFTTTAGVNLYTPVADVDRYERESFRYYNTSVGLTSEVPLTYVEYDRWRDGYVIGSLRTTQTVPTVITITPQKQIGINTPLAGYTIVGDYYRPIQLLATDTDTLDVPAAYRMVVVYLTMMKCGAARNASEIYSNGEKEFVKLMSKLEQRYLPEVTGAGALA